MASRIAPLVLKKNGCDLSTVEFGLRVDLPVWAGFDACCGTCVFLFSIGTFICEDEVVFCWWRNFLKWLQREERKKDT